MTAQQRRRLAQLADVLIPGAGEMPSASAVSAAGAAFDRTLAIRPDLEPAVARALAAVGEPEAVLRALHADEPDSFEALVLLVSCAYGTDATVRRVLGYPGQVPHPIPPEGDPLLDELLARVARRGPIYVPTPALAVRAR